MTRIFARRDGLHGEVIVIDCNGHEHEFIPNVDQFVFFAFDDGTIIRAALNFSSDDESWKFNVEHQGRNAWRIEHREDRGDSALSDLAVTDSTVQWCVAGDFAVIGQ